jgi:DNA-binding CsgD family transcriptional regulator
MEASLPTTLRPVAEQGKRPRAWRASADRRTPERGERRRADDHGLRGLFGGSPVHRTAHAAHLKVLLDHLAGAEPARDPAELAEPLSERELALLRFLPTNLSSAEIGSELFPSVDTIKIHIASSTCTRGPRRRSARARSACWRPRGARPRAPSYASCDDASYG